MAALSAYEQQRLDNIAENMRVLSTLGLSGTPLAPPQAKKPKYCRKCNEVWSAAHRATCSMRDDTRVDRVLRQRPKRVARSYAEAAGDEEEGGSGGDSGGDDEYNSNEEEEEEEEEDGDGSPSSSARSSQRGGRPRGGGEDGGSRSTGSSGRSSRQGARADDPLTVYTEDMQLAAAEAKRKAASEGLTLETSCRQGRCGYSGVRLRVVPDPSGSGPLGQSFRCALRKPSQSEVAGFNAFARPSLLVELPDGWVCLSTRRYAGPNGERARSKRQAWQISRGEVGRVSLGRGRTRGPYEAEYARVSLGRFHTAEEVRPPCRTHHARHPPRHPLAPCAPPSP